MDCKTLTCPNDCSDNGECSSNGICTCKPEFTGMDCSLSKCPNGCSNRGECKTMDSGDQKCECLPGYTGDDCATCEADFFCSGRGTCVDPLVQEDPEGAAICYCEAGSSGLECEISACPSMVPRKNCSGRGKCNQIEDTTDFECECEESYSGVECSVHVCDKECNNGTCEFGDDGSPACVCQPGLGGEDCSEKSCGDDNCGNNGICSMGVCYCEDGFLPPLCATKACPLGLSPWLYTWSWCLR